MYSVSRRPQYVKSLSKRRNGERGAATVEFAIVASLSTFLMLGVIDFGYAYYTQHLITDIARMGSRYAMVRGSSCTYGGCPATSGSIQDYVRGLALGAVPGSVTVTTTWSATDNCAASPYNGPGCLVTVEVSYPYSYFVPYLAGRSANMNSSASSVISQ